MRAKPFLIGLTTGLLGGLTTVIFTTPQPGKQLRENIQRNAKQNKAMLEELNKQFNQVKQSITTLKNEAKNNMPKVFSELKDVFNNFKTDIEPNSKKLKEELENLQKSIDEIENNLSSLNKNKTETSVS